MTGSTFAQPLPAALYDRAARAHDRRGEPHAVPWHVYPEQARGGGVVLRPRRLQPRLPRPSRAAEEIALRVSRAYDRDVHHAPLRC